MARAARCARRRCLRWKQGQYGLGASAAPGCLLAEADRLGLGLGLGLGFGFGLGLGLVCRGLASKKHLYPERRSQPYVILELPLAFCY